MPTITAITTEVQARCNALTNGSTVSAVIDCAIAAKKVELAGGNITRTVLDAQLLRINNLSDGSSTIEDLIALAAVQVVPASGSVYLPPIGSFQVFASISSLIQPAYYVDEYGCTWLKTGVLALATTYPLLASKVAYAAYEWSAASVTPCGNAKFVFWAASGSTMVRMAAATGANTIYYSVDAGVNWVAKSFSNTDFQPAFLEFDGTNFVAVGYVGGTDKIGHVTVSPANVAGPWTVTSVSAFTLGTDVSGYNPTAMAVGRDGSNYHIVVYDAVASTSIRTYYGPLASLVNKGLHTLTGFTVPTTAWGRLRSAYLAADSGFYFCSSQTGLEDVAWLYSPTANTYTYDSAGAGFAVDSVGYYRYPMVNVLGKYLVLQATTSTIKSSASWNGSRSSITAPTGFSAPRRYLGFDGTYAFFTNSASQILYTADFVTWYGRFNVGVVGSAFNPGKSATTGCDALISGDTIYLDEAGVVYTISKSAILSGTPNYCGTYSAGVVGQGTQYMRAA